MGFNSAFKGLNFCTWKVSAYEHSTVVKIQPMVQKEHKLQNTDNIFYSKIAVVMFVVWVYLL